MEQMLFEISQTTIVEKWRMLLDLAQEHSIFSTLLFLVSAYTITFAIIYVRLRLRQRRDRNRAEDARRRQRIRERMPESTKDVQNHWEGL